MQGVGGIMLAQRFDDLPDRAGMGGDPVTVLRLARSRRVGAVSFHRLLGEHGSADAAFAALPGVARAAGMHDYTPCPEGVALAELRAGHRLGARLLIWGAPDYPQALCDLPDAPPVLWVLGDPALLHRPAVAVVGARNASALGLRMARGMAGGLSQAGLTVIAGLARGIDTAAHEAALEGGTIAVLAGGLDRVYPAQNIDLAQRIAACGLLISEQPPGVEPAARLFPLRNRIVSGLSRGVVVVEAAHRSGTLITASCAADQGREVMAVPGHPMDARAAGCNALIRDGAGLVRGAGDVMALLGLADAGQAARRLGGRPALGMDTTGADTTGADMGPGAVKGAASRVARTLARFGPAAAASAGAGRFVRHGGPGAPGGSGAPGRKGGRSADPAPAMAAAIGPAADPRPGVLRRQGDEPVEVPPARLPDNGGPAALEARILALLGPSPTGEEDLLRNLGIAPAALLPVLGRLEIDGQIQRGAGARWMRA